jgi:hypothetical protein
MVKLLYENIHIIIIEDILVLIYYKYSKGKINHKKNNNNNYYVYKKIKINIYIK